MGKMRKYPNEGSHVRIGAGVVQGLEMRGAHMADPTAAMQEECEVEIQKETDRKRMEQEVNQDEYFADESNDEEEEQNDDDDDEDDDDDTPDNPMGGISQRTIIGEVSLSDDNSEEAVYDFETQTEEEDMNKEAPIWSEMEQSGDAPIWSEREQAEWNKGNAQVAETTTRTINQNVNNENRRNKAELEFELRARREGWSQDRKEHETFRLNRDQQREDSDTEVEINPTGSAGSNDPMPSPAITTCKHDRQDRAKRQSETETDESTKEK